MTDVRKALGKIEKWFGEFPPSGKYWDDAQTLEMTYAAAFGSNGERDYMRGVAREALDALPGPREQEPVGIEGVAFQDGDAFCPEGRGECQKSWTFVPECEHAAASKMVGREETRATLVLATSTQGDRE